MIASTSVSGFRSRDIDIRTIADSLGVSSVLEGAVLKVGQHVRLKVRLVDGEDGATRWSQSYDEEVSGMLALQEQIAQAIVGELDLRLNRQRGFTRSRKPRPAAYELYLLASDPVHLRSQSGIWKAQHFLERAIAADPDFASAHASLALIQVRRARSADDPGMPLQNLLALAETEARKAIALDSNLAEGHYALGRVMEAGLDFSSAEAAIRRAVAIDPTRAVYRRWLASLNAWAGRPEQELVEARRALETDPLNPYAIVAIASALRSNRRYDEALGQLRRVAAIKPPLRAASFVTAQCYAGKMMLNQAVAMLRPGAEDGDPMSTAMLGHLLARGGERDEANRILTRLSNRYGRTGSGAFQVALLHAGLGDADEAFAWLNRSIDDRTISSIIMGPSSMTFIGTYALTC